MRVAITGSTGLIGTALAPALRAAGHVPVPVVRRAPAAGEIGWDPAEGRLDPEDLADVDAVVNLAGAGIGDRRWSEERKRTLVDSRVQGTRLLAEAIAGLAESGRGPRTLLSGSAIGYYGDRGDEVLPEDAGPGDDFLAGLCTRWEAAATPAIDAGVRTAFLRTGIVQTAEGGALAKLLPLFRIGLGGRFGSGRQWFSWISMTDQVGAIVHLLDRDVAGPVNLAAPEPTTNAEFARVLGTVLRRPAFVPVPKFGPSLVLGREAADAMLYVSQRIQPRALLDAGYEFAHPTAEIALRAELGRPSA